MFEHLSSRDQVFAKQYGGADNVEDFRIIPDPNYCDKGGHKERSIYHNPQHKKHFKKVLTKHN